ncbi:MAG: alpha/beta hydrolase [Bacteroidales bacterium]|nr:alpha/beta hydrolase [Bacteroidales bacterium]
MLKRESLGKEKTFSHSNSYWQTADGLQLYMQTWAPGGTPRGVINLVHGLGEHGYRYNDWASRLAGEGFVVRSFDHRGHGRSPGKQAHIPNYQKVMDDIGLFLTMCREEYPDLPVFLYGHSLGGNFALNYVIRSAMKLDGIIVTSPWLELADAPSPILIKTVKILSRVFPAMRVWNRIRIEDLSHDLRIVHNYKTDPLVHHQITLRMFSECYQAGLKASMSIYKINSPLLLMHGSEDHITSCKASANFTRNASNKTKYIEWEGSYHELHNDLDKDKVFDALKDWLDHYANPQTLQNA